MPKIDIRRPHQLSLEQARAVVDQVAAKMNEKFDTQGAWDGDAYRFSRSGVQGSIAVTPQEVLVHAEIGLLLSPLKPTIEHEIQRKLEQYFG